jgi:hypothetical protein
LVPPNTDSGTDPQRANTVDELDLSEEEFGRLVAASRFLRFGTRAPVYLKEFPAWRLEEASAEGLAARVRGFSDEQMEALCERIRQEQS